MFVGWLGYEFGLRAADVLESGLDLNIVGIRLQEDFLKFLDESNYLQKLEEYYQKQINDHLKNNFLQPLNCYLPVDIKDLSRVSGEHFTNLLFHEPHIALSVIHKVVYTALNCIEDVPEVLPQQIQIILRPSNVSLNTSYWVHRAEYCGISTLQGIVISISKLHKYTRSTVVRCQETKCMNSKGYRASGVINTSHIHCNMCGSKLIEEFRYREMGDQVLALLVNPEAYKFSQQPLYKRSQAVLVCFQDDLVCSLRLGGCYNVIGHKQPKYFYAWNTEELINLHGEYNTKEVYSAALPKQISHLLDLLSSNDCHSPWSFVTALSSQIAADIYPASALLHLKMGMLLNLAIQGSSQKPVHLLAIGKDVLLAQRLLRQGGQLGKRYVEHFSPVFTSAVTGHTHVDEQGLQWTDAGPLLLARKGFCYLGDWAKFSQQMKHSHIVSAIETGQISFQHHGNVTERTHTSPLECSVWTYWQHLPFCSKLSDQKQIRMLINIFGIPYLCDDSNEMVEICQHILMKSILNTASEVKNNDIREFLQIVSTKNLVLKDEARQLIRSYFVACRRVRPDCLPVGAIETITALSEGHARLSLKSEVCYEDVLAVLHLYEKSLYAIFGDSFVSPPPAAMHGGHTSMKSLIMQVKNEMEQFAAWIVNYIKSVIGVHPFQYCNSEE